MTQATTRKEFPATVTKAELAQALCMSESTLQDLLNRRYIASLTALGYKIESKLISRRILIFLQQELALIPEDFE